MNMIIYPVNGYLRQESFDLFNKYGDRWELDIGDFNKINSHIDKKNIKKLSDNILVSGEKTVIFIHSKDCNYFYNRCCGYTCGCSLCKIGCSCDGTCRHGCC